ncbi:uroporphyrinogen-III synthase [Zavarzinia sp. CC-PAN008]|uniref:uroporphyrinogen-III synthase n=1 Tax=Zavarzinia sp. CC-PAN008 TaxID=3243332 RepID=UPI003F7463E7
MRLLVTRPEPDGSRLAEGLRARGHQVVLDPLLDMVPVTADPACLAGVQAVLATSANGVRHLARLSPDRALRLMCIGPASARIARDLGYARVEHASGDVASLADLVTARLSPDDGPMVHAAGSVLAGDLAAMLRAQGHDVRRVVLYDAQPADALAPATEAALRGGTLDAALFFSPRTARTFVSLARASGVEGPCAEVDALCLSNAVAAALDPVPFRAVRVAAQTTTAALLALLGIGDLD